MSSGLQNDGVGVETLAKCLVNMLLVPSWADVRLSSLLLQENFRLRYKIFMIASSFYSRTNFGKCSARLFRLQVKFCIETSEFRYAVLSSRVFNIIYRGFESSFIFKVLQHAPNSFESALIIAKPFG